jgi:hypothetical protein
MGLTPPHHTFSRAYRSYNKNLRQTRNRQGADTKARTSPSSKICPYIIPGSMRFKGLLCPSGIPTPTNMTIPGYSKEQASQSFCVVPHPLTKRRSRTFSRKRLVRIATGRGSACMIDRRFTPPRFRDDLDPQFVITKSSSRWKLHPAFRTS